jgi:hypothetical protein
MKKRDILLIMLITLLISFVLVQGAQKIEHGIKKEMGSELNKNILSKDIKENETVFIKFEEKDLPQINKLIENKKLRKTFKDGVSIEISKKDLEKLEKEKYIKEIIPIKEYTIDLQDSVGIVGANQAWNLQLNNVNLTGLGQTVCIIDTGINYTHPNLASNYLGGYDFYNNDNDPKDDNGHGTHVSGIIAANGSIKGIAPEAKLVGMKVCSSAGSCSTDNIRSAINWCVGNRTLYNISVISMSLGADCNTYPEDCYTDYCNNDFLASSVNLAVQAGISVVIASGNDGYYNFISSPACIENATPVTSTGKTDISVSSFANTWNNTALSILAAPGENINSTMIRNPAGNTLTSCGTGKDYCSLSGTSMATPHVAGAIAIIKQWLNATGQSKTPGEIEILLNNTGKIIEDNAYSKRNFTRINISNAINNLPFINVLLVSPINNLFTSSNQTFRCNASTSNSLTNVTFYIWNSTSSLINNSNISITGINNASNFTFNFTYENNYRWNCLFTDSLNHASFATTNFSVTYDLTPPALNITSPINNSWYNAGIFNITLNENGSCLYSLNYGINNFTMSSVDNQNFNATNATLLQDNSYNVSFYCNDSAGNRNNSIRTFKIDLIPPNVTLTDPFPTDETSNSVSKIFYYNVSDNLNLSRCNLILNGASVAENATEITNTTNNITYTLTPAIYSWNINCTDIAGNIGNSSSRSIVITSPPVTVNNNNGGGGGGGGGSPSSGVNSILNAQQSEQGTSRELKTNDKITFEIKTPLGNEKHSLVLNNITDSRINITISSNPINLILGVGQSAKLNLTSSDYYNLFIKLEGIRENKANLTVKVINEPIKITAEENNESIQQMETPQNTKKENNVIYYVLEALIIIIIIALIRYLMKQPKRTRSRR